MKVRMEASIFVVSIGVAVLVFSIVLTRRAALGQTPATPRPAAGETKPAPRTPDGKPDLSGTWVGGGSFGGFGGAASPMELTPWGIDKFTWNKEPAAPMTGGPSRVELDPVYHCYPAGMVRLGPPLDVPGGFAPAFQITQIPGKVVIFYEFAHEVRFIYTDGRDHPKTYQPTWNGHSIGRWDGDTLVVDTIGLRDETWLDSQGHEHSTQLRVVERFQRPDLGTLEVERTLTDPVSLAKPRTIRIAVRLRPDYDIDENIDGRQNDCTGYMIRKHYFGEGDILGISEHP